MLNFFSTYQWPLILYTLTLAVPTAAGIFVARQTPVKAQDMIKSALLQLWTLATLLLVVPISIDLLT